MQPAEVQAQSLPEDTHTLFRLNVFIAAGSDQA